MDAKMKRNKLLVITNQRLREEGWENVTQFTNGSKVPYSLETVRRAFVDTGPKVLSPETLAVILKFLNFSKSEIKEILQTYTDDKVFWKLIGDENDSYTEDEKAIVSAYRKLASNPDTLKVLVDNLAFVAKAASIDIEEDIKVLKRGSKKRG